jgi:Spy/CpxP family protein refolding chaperone
VILPDADFFSLDLADAAFFAPAFAALAATFAVAADELLAPALSRRAFGGHAMGHRQQARASEYSNEYRPAL